MAVSQSARRRVTARASQKESFLSKAFKAFSPGKPSKKSAYPAFAMAQSYLQPLGKAVWSARNYDQFADEAYRKNVVAHRCIHMVSKAVGSVSWVLHREDETGRHVVEQHPLLALLKRPGACMYGSELIESLCAYRMIDGNAYLLAVQAEHQEHPKELFILRPDRVRVVAGKNGVPAGYEYQVEHDTRRFMVNQVRGHSPVLHLKYFNPLNDWYGMSPVEAAAYSIDQHNQAGVWNQALLQNGAKPSGALVMQAEKDGSGSHLSDEQFVRIREQIDTQFSGAANAGRPLLLEGGLDWKEMSLSPRDMDFIESKHSSARDIAQAFGVPPQLLGIPGDNTYSNMVEARMALWEQTILPVLDDMTQALGGWLVPMFSAPGQGQRLWLDYDKDAISALAPRREAMWQRLQRSDFMTVNEKRRAVGLGPIEDGNTLD